MIRLTAAAGTVIDKETRLAVGDNYLKEFQEYLKRHSLGGGKGSS